MNLHEEYSFPHTLEKTKPGYWCSSCYGTVTRQQIDAGVWMKYIGSQCPAVALAHKEKEPHTNEH